MRRIVFIGLGLVLIASQLQAQAPSPEQMAARIDRHLAARWQAEGVRPAPPASDAEFLRRASLDLKGIIPSVNEVYEFLNNTGPFKGLSGPGKRARLIELLLDNPKHFNHFANIWRSVMLPSDSNVTRFGQDRVFQSWLYDQFRRKTPYDEMVRSLLTTTGNSRAVGPGLFYAALEVKPEELAASTSRIFLGVQIQCAQCHNHPFDHWTRKDFWGYAAFFGQLQGAQGQQRFVAQVADTNSGEVKIPDTDEIVPPKYLGGATSPDDETTRRQRLAAWLTGDENPYFAKAAVNRVWAILFGRGLVDPVDDLGEHNKPSHPRLLDELARYFVATKYDVRQLVHTLTATKAYQLSSQSAEDTPDRPELFARMAIKSLTAEQLYDCLLEAMRKREGTPASGRGVINRGFDQNRQAFLAKFSAPTAGATEYEAGIPQALTLMNGRLVRDATDLSNSDILIAIDDAPFNSDEDCVNTLFLSTLSRFPNDRERARFVAHAKRSAAAGERRKGLGDILWALLNSAEFVLNH